MRVTLAAAIALASIAPAAAMDAQAARQYLLGAWTAPGETWIFGDDGSWQQFVGGVTYESSFTTEAMPENLFVLVSSSGKRYVVHTSTNPRMMAVYAEGQQRPLGTFLRRTD